MGAYFANPAEHTDDQKRVIKDSDAYVSELLAADILMIGTPMYNFGPPATLKAWIDLVARVGKTFKYGPNGPEGLVEGKRAYIVATTGRPPSAVRRISLRPTSSSSWDSWVLRK